MSTFEDWTAEQWASNANYWHVLADKISTSNRLLQAENDALRRENEGLKRQNQQWNSWVGELQNHIYDLEHDIEAIIEED
jgi:hypothetical protein